VSPMSIDELDELLDVGRTGRADLIADLRKLVAVVRAQRRELRDLGDNLTATQTRCTELLLESRELRSRLDKAIARSREKLEG
jgi:regulator of replication initiation timing